MRRYRAPGRVNLIGEHTDYNDGFVLPTAIAYAARLTARPRRDRRVSVVSRGFVDTHEFDLDELEEGVMGLWSDHVRGILIELQHDGARLCGVDLAIESDVPVGAGLSSSAAVGIAVGYGVLDMAGYTVDRVALAKAVQRSENAHVGANVGIMDQFVSANASEGCALMLDTRSLACEYIALPAAAAFVVCNTMVAHAHGTGDYNVRRAECEAGVAVLRGRYPHVSALRDVALPELESARPALSDVVYRRCRHVITENARTLAAARHLAAGELDGFGRAMNASHASMRDDFEISAPAVETLVGLVGTFEPGVYGARMTGGGFGGCIVALVALEAVDAFVDWIGPAYQAAVGVEPAIYRGVGAAGAGRIA